MDEKVITLSVNNEHINGILHIPDHYSGQKVMVIFLHGWAGYRTGPHDMFVKLARKLSKGGYYAIRFDFRGRGYSHGCSKAISYETMLEDLETIIDFVKKELSIQQIVLLGICSGAKLALYHTKNSMQAVNHVIELSSPVLRYTEIANTLQLSMAKASISLYFFKIFHNQTWLKLFSGEIHFFKILHTMLTPLRNLEISFRKRIKKAAARNTPATSFSHFYGNMLLIHGEKDPETSLSVSQISALLQKHKIWYETHMIKGANHSFYSLKWEQEISDIIAGWLNERFILKTR